MNDHAPPPTDARTPDPFRRRAVGLLLAALTLAAGASLVALRSAAPPCTHGGVPDGSEPGPGSGGAPSETASVALPSRFDDAAPSLVASGPRGTGPSAPASSGALTEEAEAPSPRRRSASSPHAGEPPAALGGPSAPTAAALPTAALAVAPLPTSGVIASTFVGGSGTAARLGDLLDRGVVVGGEHIRLTAFDELGRLPYAVPARDAVAVYAELERSRLLEEGERVHLQIALMAREGEAPPRPRMDIRLVLDRSGSMAGAKWDDAIRAAHALVDRLEPGDRFGLVSYADDASLDLPPGPVGDRRAAHEAIARLVPGGATNLEAALRLARDHAPRRERATDVPLVVLVSDGQATVGVTSADALADLARETFEHDGALTTAVGLGTDFDEETMLSIAREGSGSYHFVRRPEDIDGILRDELEARALAVAQDLRLRIVVAPGVTVRRIYGSRVLSDAEEAEVRRTEVAVDERLARELGIPRDRRDDVREGLRMHIPTFRRGDQHVVLLELEVPAGTRRGDVARVELDYKDLAGATNEHRAVAVRAERTEDREAASTSVRRPVKRTVLAFQAADALQQAASALEEGDTSAAHAALEERIVLLRTAAALWDDEALRADADILSRYAQVIDGAWGAFPYDEQRTLLLAMNYYGDERMR